MFRRVRVTIRRDDTRANFTVKTVASYELVSTLPIAPARQAHGVTAELSRSREKSSGNE